ncbi:hypothetical protein U1P98_18690 [Lysinibacillus irui]|uniref:Uncharacterized protein n=1 Tax=Lysinibacillus irui TaxID=2998077 RepID=A0ABU5NQP7_9BACI|nr:hypothetical protein [Lysinibacillus irui]MEA0556084.1 hypothetical protein [Lysinibacillus irui]MEA0978338.1 hypothetical protein [Lysinibacillus irui]MEA1044492.1 hypothetical protein [Lysinibacillus irui]
MTLTELANQPTQEKILEKVENIDLYSGTTVNADGKKLVPVTLDALVPKVMISDLPNAITTVAIWENFLFTKTYSSSYAYLYNKSTGEITRFEVTHDTTQKLQPVLGNYMQAGKYMCNDGFAIINDQQVGPVLLYTGVYGGTASYAVQIELNRIKGQFMTYSQSDQVINLPGWTSTAPKVCQTRKYVIFHRNGVTTDYIMGDKKYNSIDNPLRRVAWTTGIQINGMNIVAVYRISDAMLEDKDVVLMAGATGVGSTPTAGFAALVNIVTKQVLSFVNLSTITAAQNIGEAPIYQNDEGIQIYTGGANAGSVVYFNRNTLEFRVLYNRTNYNYGHVISADDKSIVLEMESHQPALGADMSSSTIRMKRERIFFDGSISEVLPVGLLPLEYLGSTLNTGGQVNALIGWNGDKYIGTYGLGNIYTGLYTAEWNQVITSYKEVIE